MRSASAPRKITSNRYPAFIRNNKALQKYGKQEKIFPKIGLVNDEQGIRKGHFKGCKIVFSGSGNRGLWDIATMSERGIESCQSWNGGASGRLIGSMLDPYCGIIYIAGKNGQMKRRAVVRFVINNTTGKPAVMLEPVYHAGHYWSNRGSDNKGMFKAFLKKRLGRKIPVFSCYDRSRSGSGYNMASEHRIPFAKVLNKTVSRSYRDSGIQYANHPKYSDVSKVKANEIK